MRTAVRIALVGLLRRRGRTAIRVLVIAAAVAAIGAMVLFIGDSLRTMAASAENAVALDWQGPVSSERQALRVAREVSTQPGVAEASPVATAPFASASRASSAGTIRTGSGSVLAVPPGYLRHIRTFRFLHGSLRPGQVVLDQQLSATLQAGVGDSITLTARRGAPARVYRVSGVALVTSPDVLFQPLNPQAGPAPAQPPAQIAILPLDTFAATLAPSLHTLTPATVGSSAVPGAQDGVQWQVQAQIAPASLGTTPAQALTRAGQLRNRVERSLPGQVQFVDNLADSLSSATGDALYAETLYIMLAVPGAIVALGLAYLAALGTAEADRRELSLLRARGASRRLLLGLAAVESIVIGLVAGILGAAFAVLAVKTITSGVALTPQRTAVAAAIAVAVAAVGAAATRIGAGARVFARRSGEIPRSRKPLWQRLYLDLAALAVSGLIYWLTARTGFSAVVNPDSNPTLSLSVYMFFAPALLWLGATLFLVRLRGRALTFFLARRRPPTTLTGFILASAGRRGAAINRGLVLVGLLLAFGVNLGIFTATYDQQARVDAQLTLGADVVATAPPGAVARDRLTEKIARVPGVTATSALDHSYAYVGPDLQDTYGVDAVTLSRATTLRDSYFLGGSAATMMRRLQARRDGVLVSKETVTDYSLSLGDLLKLRVLDRSTGRFVVVPFHVLGIVTEFPSAPKDSFMVTNASYLRAATHDRGPNVVLARTSGDPVGTARRVAAATHASGTTVKDIRTQTSVTVSSITTVDLTGIARIEELFAVVLAAAAMTLFVAIGLGERRHEFATMAALGASLRDVGAFLWAEAAIVLAAAFALAAGLGWLLSEMLVAMLQHVFDPPPDALAAPWGFLLGLAGAAALGALVAGATAVGGIRRLNLGAILREQ